jgi:hypothetical protein
MWAAHQEGGFLVRYVGLADFLVDRNGTKLTLCDTWALCSRETLCHLLLDQALPLVLGLRGFQTLHASAVLTPKGVCAFLGSAGAGKSTLAASFSAANFPVLADDCTAIREDSGGFFIVPAYPGLRLWSDSAHSLLAKDWSGAPVVAHYSQKRRILSFPSGEKVPMRLEPLTVIYSLARESGVDEVLGLPEPAIERSPASEAFLQLLSANFILDITDRTVLANNLRFVERLLRGVAIRRLKIPNAFSSLPKVREVVLKDIGAMDLGATSGQP